MFPHQEPTAVAFHHAAMHRAESCSVPSRHHPVPVLPRALRQQLALFRGNVSQQQNLPVICTEPGLGHKPHFLSFLGQLSQGGG